MNIDMEKYNQILGEALQVKERADYYKSIVAEQEKTLEFKAEEIKKLLPKGYWWTCDIDTSWDRPKKYSIKKIEFYKDGITVTVKEVFKRLPWPGFTGEHTFFSLDSFLALNIYKTEEEAKNRPCPKCGSPMGYAKHEWCDKCMSERYRIKEEFEKAHTFYDPKKDNVYKVGYTDELTAAHPAWYWRGFDGKHFTLQRIDTGEIIETNNLWSEGSSYKNKEQLPKIVFIGKDPYER